MKVKSCVAWSAAVTLSAGMLALAPVAAADDTDGFLDQLNTLNASPPGLTPQGVISAGYQTCSNLRGGGSVLDEIDAVEGLYGFDQGTLFVSTATTFLCPDFAG